MKRYLIAVTGAALLLFGTTLGATPSIDVIATYHIWENSMCSQNCTVHNLGNLPTTLKEPGLNQKVLQATGSIVTVQELPTVAGPRPQVQNPDQKVTVNKFKPRQYKVTERFVQVMRLRNENRRLAIRLKNPFDRRLKLKIEIDSAKPLYIKLAANATTEYKYQFRGTAQNQLKLNIKSSWLDNESQDLLRAASSQGALVDLSMRIDTNRLPWAATQTNLDDEDDSDEDDSDEDDSDEDDSDEDDSDEE